MAIEAKKLRARLDQWNVYNDQQAAVTAPEPDPVQDPPMFSWEESGFTETVCEPSPSESEESRREREALREELECERQRIQQLQTQLAQEVIFTRHAKLAQEARPWLRSLRFRVRPFGAAFADTRKAAGASSPPTPRYRLNTVKWRVILVLTAGLSSVVAAMVANKMLP
jgi:hypothetical protein